MWSVCCSSTEDWLSWMHCDLHTTPVLNWASGSVSVLRRACRWGVPIRNMISHHHALMSPVPDGVLTVAAFVWMKPCVMTSMLTLTTRLMSAESHTHTPPPSAPSCVDTWIQWQRKHAEGRLVRLKAQPSMRRAVELGYKANKADKQHLQHSAPPAPKIKTPCRFNAPQLNL